MIKLVPREKALIRKLQQIKENIFEEYKDAEIEKMRKAESETVQELMGLLKSPANYQKFLVFKKEFYEANDK